METQHIDYKRILFLLRHAKAEFGDGLSDFDRPLASEGMKQAKTLGTYLNDHAILPEHIYCSSAHRTLQTSENLLESIDRDIEVTLMKEMYNASQGDLLHVAQSLDNELTSAMFVAHNPGIHALANTLTQMSNDKKRKELVYTYRPCTLTIIGSNIENWAEAGPQSFDLIDYISFDHPLD